MLQERRSGASCDDPVMLLPLFVIDDVRKRVNRSKRSIVPADAPTGSVSSSVCFTASAVLCGFFFVVNIASFRCNTGGAT